MPGNRRYNEDTGAYIAPMDSSSSGLHLCSTNPTGIFAVADNNDSTGKPHNLCGNLSCMPDSDGV